MENISFDEDTSNSRARGLQTAASKIPTLYRFVIWTGLASTERGAERVLLGFALVCIAVAVAFPFLFGSSTLRIAPDASSMTTSHTHAPVPSTTP